MNNTPNSKLEEAAQLEEIALAAATESGDAKKAWQLLARNIDATSQPSWVKRYVKRSAEIIEAYDVENGDQALLAHMLGFYRETPKFSRAVYDYDHLFEWFTDRMMSDTRKGLKLNVSRTAREYYEEVMKHNGSPDAIRKAYETARTRFSKQLANDLELQQMLAERD